MTKKASGPQIATANRLHDGLVVFLTPDGEWARTPDRARVAQNANEAGALEDAAVAAARDNLIVDPYLVEVGHDGDAIVPVAHRERMRISGPSVSTSLNGQANGALAHHGQMGSSAIGHHVQI